MKRREFLSWLTLAGLGVSVKPLSSLELEPKNLSGAGPHLGKISFDRKSLILNARRKYIFSGSLHYYRFPSPKQWESRLKKLKQIGFNAIDTYFYWAYHSPEPGKYNFSGNRDVELFMKMIDSRGMYFIARPGPYICAEVDGGGFPGWLITRNDLALRCRRNGKPVYDPEYMKYVEEWFAQILPRINCSKNLILLQIENEYGFHFTPSGLIAQLQGAIQRQFGEDVFMRVLSNEIFQQIQTSLARQSFKKPDYRQENRYIKELYKMARKYGVKVPLFHNDVGGATKRFIDVDIVAIDDYPITNFATDWKKDNPFARIDLLEEAYNALGINCPIFLAELQGGWYDLWGGYGYENIRKHLGPLAMDMTLKSCLAQGVSIINIFVACGGTNWGYLSSPDNYTSYDYGAPITEGGKISERAEPCRRFSQFVAEHESELLESESADELGKKSGELFLKIRKAPSGTCFVFARNLTGKDQTIRTELGDFKISYPAMEVWVIDKNGRKLDYFPSINQMKSKSMVFFASSASLPELTNFRFKEYQAPFERDQLSWERITGRTDIDGIGAHYGFVWYRTEIGRVNWIKIDARHLWALYLNGKLIKAYDNFRNRLGTGPDLAKTIKVRLPRHLLKEENTLVLLTESLGHNKGFMEDHFNPRGLVFARTKKSLLRWEVCSGLLPEEKGITPKVDFSSLIKDAKSINLPHQFSSESALGIYLAKFELNLKKPAQPALGVKINASSGRANIYINGWLVGRYWAEVGPQKVFYLPPDLLNLRGKNQLQVVVWGWKKQTSLTELELVEYY